VKISVIVNFFDCSKHLHAEKCCSHHWELVIGHSSS
jgi:hypothetical protein